MGRQVAADVVTIPSSGLLRLDDGTYVVDVVDDDGSLDRRAVAIGAVVGTRTVIESGLAPGDQIIDPCARRPVSARVGRRCRWPPCRRDLCG